MYETYNCTRVAVRVEAVNAGKRVRVKEKERDCARLFEKARLLGIQYDARETLRVSPRLNEDKTILSWCNASLKWR